VLKPDCRNRVTPALVWGIIVMLDSPYMPKNAAIIHQLSHAGSPMLCRSMHEMHTNDQKVHWTMTLVFMCSYQVVTVDRRRWSWHYCQRHSWGHWSRWWHPCGPQYALASTYVGNYNVNWIRSRRGHFNCAQKNITFECTR
jgi:hypothetical protein